MLYWICPECGHECSPAIRECPTCTAPPVEQAVPKSSLESTPLPSSAPTSAIQGLRSLAQNVLSPASAAAVVPTAAPQRQLLRMTNGGEASASTSAVAVQAVAVQEETPEPELLQKLAPLNNIQIQPARPGPSEPEKLMPAAVPVRASSPAIAPLLAPTRREFGLELASVVPAEISFQPAHPGHAEVLHPSAEPLTSRRQSVAMLRGEFAGASDSGLPLGHPAQNKLVAPNESGEPEHRAASISTPLAYEQTSPAFLPSSVQLAGDCVAELLNLLKTSAKRVEQTAIDAIKASFRQEPAFSLLPVPLEIVTAPAPPSWQWKHSARPMFTAIAPPSAARDSVFGPQAPTLAGPSLPPQLLNLDQRNSRVDVNRKRPTWPLSLLIATLMILGAVSLLQYVMQDRDGKSTSDAAPVQAIKSVPAPANRVPIVEEHPAARSVEVAGIRIVTGPGNRPQLRYIVINHASREVMGLNIRIAVRSVDGLGGPPLFSVSSMVASLGPDESKEIRTNLDSSIPSSSIPDWQSLRTEVVIARQ